MSREQGVQTVYWQMDAKLIGAQQRARINGPLLGEALL